MTGSLAPGRAWASSTDTSRPRSRSGDVRVYRLDQHEATYTEDGQTTTLPATKSFELSGSMNHAISRNVRARARLDYFSESSHSSCTSRTSIRPREQSRDRRRLVRRLRPDLDERLLYIETESSAAPTAPHVYGSTPRVLAAVAPQRLFGSPVYASVNAEYALPPSRSSNDDSVVHDNSHGRMDVAPTLRVPLSRLTYLSVNASATYRAT